MRFILKAEPGYAMGDVTPLAAVFICAVAVVTTGDETTGICETAKSEPDMPVTSVDDADVIIPG